MIYLLLNQYYLLQQKVNNNIDRNSYSLGIKIQIESEFYSTIETKKEENMYNKNNVPIRNSDKNKNYKQYSKNEKGDYENEKYLGNNKKLLESKFSSKGNELTKFSTQELYTIV